MLLVVLLTGLICILTGNYVILQTSAAENGYLDFDNLPETNFSCEGKVIGGYYADTETGCQMFHVCTIGQKGEVSDIKFLCLNGTVFDQETRVCERLDEVDCSKSESYYDLNLELYGNSGATYGIQPENEEEPVNNDNDEDKCLEEEEDCKTELLPNKSEAEDEYGDVEESDDATQSTTSTTSTERPTTSARPQHIPYPTSSPETIAALLALHNAFQESLKEHERPASERVPSVFPISTSPAVKPAVHNFNKERVPPPPPPPRFSSPVSFSTSPRPISFVLNNQNYAPTHVSNAQPAQVSNHHFPAPPQNHKQQSFHFNLSKPKPVINSFTPTVRTSQAFGNSNFQQSFHEASQEAHLDPEDDEEYSAVDYQQSQPSTTRPFAYNPYHHNQNRFAINHDHIDSEPETKPNPSSPSNFHLAQLKLRFNENQPVKHPGAHGFTRAVSNQLTKVLTYPEKPPSSPSTTTPAISVVLSKSSTSSIVRSVSSRNQSAITVPHSYLKVNNETTKYVNPTTVRPIATTSPNTSHTTSVEDYIGEEEYDYLEEELDPDPFYNDVPKLDRPKRQTAKKVEISNREIARTDNNTPDQLQNKKSTELLHLSEQGEKILKRQQFVKLVKFLNSGEIMNLERSPPTPPSLYNYTVPKESMSHRILSAVANNEMRNGEKNIRRSDETSKTVNKLTENLSESISEPSEQLNISSKIVKPMNTLYKKVSFVESNGRSEESREYLSIYERSDWFKNNSIYFSSDDHFSPDMCTKNKKLFNKFIPSDELNLNETSPYHFLGTKYVQFCKQSNKQKPMLGKAITLFLIESQAYINQIEFNKLKKKRFRKNNLAQIIEWKSKIKTLQLMSNKKTFKVMDERHTDINPKLIINAINRIYRLSNDTI